MKRLILVLILLPGLTRVEAQPVRKVSITELETIIRESKTPLIVNFWATYCQPCIEEMPYFQRMVAGHRRDSVRLLLVSLDMGDDYAKVRPFIVNRKVTAPVLWLNETNADYFCPKIDSTWSGAIPATIFVNNKTGYRRFYEGQVSEERLKTEIMAILEKN